MVRLTVKARESDMEEASGRSTDNFSDSLQIAELPDACLKKIHEFERELNKEGYWNIALVAYQLKG